MFTRIKIIISQLEDIWYYTQASNRRVRKELEYCVRECNSLYNEHFTFTSSLEVFDKEKLIYSCSLGTCIPELKQVIIKYIDKQEK